MEDDEARALLSAQRAELEQLLGDTQADQRQDRDAEREVGGNADPAQSLTAEGVDDAVVAGLTERLAAIGRAEKRLADGTYGRSVRSGDPIPTERLRANPAAELTVGEAAESQ
jgi:DnaK suppressor protein